MLYLSAEQNMFVGKRVEYIFFCHSTFNLIHSAAEMSVSFLFYEKKDCNCKMLSTSVSN